MRNLYDSQGFILETEKLLKIELGTSTSQRVLSSITPSEVGLNFENSYRILDLTKTNLIVLILLSWELPEDIGVLLRLDIEEKIRNTDLDFLELALESRGTCYCFLLDTNLWSTRDFFGNVLTRENIKFALKSFRPVRKSFRRPKRRTRHRGYDDKGTLRRESDKHDLWISTDEQMRLEDERLSSEATLAFLSGFVT